MQNKKVTNKKQKKTKLPNTKPKTKMAWFKIFVGIACIAAIGAAIFVTITEISLRSTTNVNYHITTTNPSISKNGDVKSTKIILWKGANKDDKDHLKYTVDKEGLVVINDDVVSIASGATISAPTTIKIEGNIKGHAVSTNIDLQPSAKHNYHTTASNPYLQYLDETKRSLILTTKDNGVVVDAQYQIPLGEEISGCTINGNVVEISELSGFYAGLIPIDIKVNGIEVGTISITRLGDTTPTDEYIMTETSGVLTTNGGSITASVIESSPGLSLANLLIGDAALNDSYDFFKIKDGVWSIRVSDTFIFDPYVTYGIMIYSPGWISDDDKINLVQFDILTIYPYANYYATASPNCLIPDTAGYFVSTITTKWNGIPVYDTEYIADPEASKYISITTDNNTTEVSWEGSSYPEDITEATIDIYLKGTYDTDNPIFLTSVIITLFPESGS